MGLSHLDAESVFMAEDSPAQYGFLRQIFADTALKSFAMRQHYSPFALSRQKFAL